MHRALLELTIEGVETSRDFHLRVMEDAEFRAGAIEIQWLERRLAGAHRERRRRVTASCAPPSPRCCSPSAIGTCAGSRREVPRRRSWRRRRRDGVAASWLDAKDCGDRARCASARSRPSRPAATASAAPKAWSSSCRERRRAMSPACASLGAKRFARGQLVSLDEPSPARVEPPCPHYTMDRCGGCQLQHLALRRAARGEGRDHWRRAAPHRTARRRRSWSSRATRRGVTVASSRCTCAESASDGSRACIRTTIRSASSTSRIVRSPTSA